MKRRTLCLLLALMLTAQLVLPAVAEAAELQSAEETVAQELEKWVSPVGKSISAPG